MHRKPPLGGYAPRLFSFKRGGTRGKHVRPGARAYPNMPNTQTTTRLEDAHSLLRRARAYIRSYTLFFFFFGVTSLVLTARYNTTVAEEGAKRIPPAYCEVQLDPYRTVVPFWEQNT